MLSIPMKKLLVYFVSLIFFSCSPSAFVLRQMTPVLENSAQALYEESDLQIAEQALVSNLKLLEGLLKSDPQNKELLLLLAQGWSGYALGFAEDEDPQRAKLFYLRARDYALRVLNQKEGFGNARKQGAADLEPFLKTFNKEDIPALFWTGFAWAGFANLSLDNPDAILALPEIQLYMQRVEELQSDYFYGAVYLFQGSMYGMKPRIMGGDPQKAGTYFEKNFKLNKGRFLLAYVYAAKFYAAKILDEELFDQYLNHIIETPVDVRPGLQLFNQIAKKKARILKEQKEELF